MHIRQHHGMTDDGAYVVLCRGEGKEWLQYSSPVELLQLELPGIDPPENAFATMNQFYCPRYPARRSDLVRYLPSVWIDFDAYKVGKSVNDVSERLINEHFDHRIPMPSYMLYSSAGGVWAVWLIEPMRAWPEVVADHRLFLQHLARRYSDLGADLKATDPARVARLPGSLHPSGHRVTAHWLSTERYRFEELAEAFAFETADKRKQKRKGKKAKGKIARPDWKWTSRQYNRWTLAYRRVSDLAKLNELRGGIKQGHRELAIFLLRNWYEHVLNYSRDAAIEECTAFAATFDPPLSPSEVAKQATPRQYYKYTTAKIIDMLDITEDEMRHLATLISRRERWRRKVGREVMTRKEYLAAMAQQTQDTSRRVADAYGRMPGATQGEIAQAVGLTQQAVSYHLKKLGLQTHKPGRPRRTKQLTLPPMDNTPSGTQSPS